MGALVFGALVLGLVAFALAKRSNVAARDAAITDAMRPHSGLASWDGDPQTLPPEVAAAHQLIASLRSLERAADMPAAEVLARALRLSADAHVRQRAFVTSQQRPSARVAVVEPTFDPASVLFSDSAWAAFRIMLKNYERYRRSNASLLAKRELVAIENRYREKTSMVDLGAELSRLKSLM
jgi:hypothetical protein